MPSYSNSNDPIGIADGYTVAEAYNPNETDRSTVEHITRLFEDAQDARVVYERQWELYRLYLKGEQLLYRDASSNELVRVLDFDNKRLFSINNHCRPAARSLVGKLARLVPTFTVVPATAEQDEVYGARVADAFFNFFRRREKLNIKFVQVQQALPWCGTGCIQLCWDPNKGREFAYCDTCGFMETPDNVGILCPQCEQYNLVSTREGDVSTIVRDPRDIYVEPGAVGPENLRYIIVRTAEPVTEIRRKFPEMGKYIKVETGIFAEKTARLTYSTTTGNWGVERLNDHAYLYEYHEAPTETFPEGRVVWMANNIILEEKPSPYKKFGRLPFFFNFWERNPGEFWGEPFMAQAWHRQKELNQLETQIREHVELLCRTKVLVPMGTRIPTDEITATTGQIIKYNRLAGMPEYLRPPELPQSVFVRDAGLKEDIRMQAGITAQEQGMTTGETSGRAMAIVEAESDQTVGPILQYNNSEWMDFYRCLLILVRDFYHPDRQFVVAGAEGMDTYSFRDMNLTEGWDLELEIEDGLAKNQAVRLQQALDMANIGLFTNPQTGQLDVPKLAKVAKIKIPGISPDTNSTEFSAAQAMIKKIEDGEPVQPQMFDDPAIFSQVFLGWLRSQGRNAPPQLLLQVEQVWQYYTMWAMSGQMGAFPGQEQGAQGQGQPSQPGQDMTAPGGSANTAGHMGTGASTGTVPQEAGRSVQMADRAAEAQARVSQQHEG